MTFQTERESLEEFFVNNYTLPAGVERYFENVPDVRDASPHIVMSVRSGDQNEGSFGTENVLFRNEGFVVFEVYGSLNEGTGEALGIVDGIAAIWRKQRIGGIMIKGLTVNRIGERNGWYQINLLVNFQRDEFF